LPGLLPIRICYRLISKNKSKLIRYFQFIFGVKKDHKNRRIQLLVVVISLQTKAKLKNWMMQQPTQTQTV